MLRQSGERGVRSRKGKSTQPRDKEVEMMSIDLQEASRQEDFHSPAGTISYAEQPILVRLLPRAWNLVWSLATIRKGATAH